MGKCSRNLSILFNVIFLLGGIYMVAIGGWVRVNFNSFQQTVGNEAASLVSNFDIVLIVIGAITTLLAFIGCYGAVKKNRFFLILFIIIMLLMVIGEIVALVFIFAFTSDFRVLVSESAENTIRNDYGDSSVAGVSATEGWDFAQKTFVCCGFNDGSDYASSAFSSSHTFVNPWPESCCAKDNAGDFVDLSTCRTGASPAPEVYHTSGCADKIINVALQYAPLVGGVVGVTMLVQLMAIVFSIVIFRAAKENRVGSDF